MPEFKFVLSLPELGHKSRAVQSVRIVKQYGDDYEDAVQKINWRFETPLIHCAFLGPIAGDKGPAFHILTYQEEGAICDHFKQLKREAGASYRAGDSPSDLFSTPSGAGERASASGTRGDGTGSIT